MFRRILKIVGIVMLSGVGVIGATAGVLAIKGEFSNKKYKPNALTFESTEMYVDNSMDDLSFKIFADSEKVNVTDISLHILEGEELIEITSDETNIDEDITFRLKELSDTAASSSKGKVVIEARNSDNTVSTYPNNLTIYVDRLTEAVSILDTNNSNNNNFWWIAEDDKKTYYNGAYGTTKTITINVGDEYQLTPLFYPEYSNHPISEKSPKIVEYYMKDKEELNGTLYTSNGSYYVRGERAGDFVIRVATYASYSIQDELEASRPSNELDVERDYRLNSMVVSEIKFEVKNIDVDSITMDGSAPEFELGKTSKVVLNNATSGAYNLGINLYKNGTPVEQKLNEVRFVDDVPKSTPGSYLTFVDGDGQIVNKYFDINYLSGSGNNRTFEITPLRYVANLSLKLTVINADNYEYTKTISNIGIDYTCVDAKINKDIIIPIGESGVSNVSLADYLTVDNAQNTYSKVLYFVVVPEDDYLDKIPYDVIPRVRHNSDYLIGFDDGNGNVVLDQLRCKAGSIATTQIYAVVVRSSLDGTMIFDKYGTEINISKYIDDPDNPSADTSIINLAFSGTDAQGVVVSSSHIRHKVTPVYTIGDIVIYLDEGTKQDGVIDEPDVTDPGLEPDPDPDPEPAPDDPVNLSEPDPDVTEPDNKYELRATAWRLREQYTTGNDRPESGPTLVIRDQGTINALAYALQNAKANNFNYSLSARAYNGASMIGTLGSNEITFGELKPYTAGGDVWTDGDIETIDCYKCTLNIKNYPTLTGFNDETVIRFFLNYSYNDYVSKAEESEMINILSGAVTGISVADHDDTPITAITVKADWSNGNASYTMYINGDTTGEPIAVETNFLAEYIHFTPDYAINQSYTYSSSNSACFEVTYQGTDLVLVFKKSGTGTLTITSTDNVNIWAEIDITVEVPENSINGDDIGVDNPKMVYSSNQGLLALVSSQLKGAGITFSIESVDVNGTAMTDYSGIVSLDSNGILSKDNHYLNDNVTVKVKASSIFAEDRYLYITLSSPVSVKNNPENKTYIVYAGTTFAIAQFLGAEATPDKENSPLIITQNDTSASLTYKLDDKDYTDKGSVNDTILIDTSKIDIGEHTFGIYLNGIFLTEYKFRIVSNAKLEYTESNPYEMEPDGQIENISSLVQIKKYDATKVYYTSYDEPDKNVPITTITPSNNLTVDNNVITAGWIESESYDTYVYFNDNEELKLYIRIVNDMSASLSVSKGTVATAIDVNSALNITSTGADADGWSISNITAPDSNVKYINNRLIYDAFVSEDKTVTLHVTIENDGKKWKFTHSFTFTPLLPTISTGARVNAGTGHQITDFIPSELTYDYVEGAKIKSGTKNVTITIGLNGAPVKMEEFDYIFDTLAPDDIIAVNLNDQSSFTIGANVGNGAKITLNVKVTYGDMSIIKDDFVIMALPTEELVITYPTITDGAENVQAGDSIDMFAIDRRFGSSYQRVIHSFKSNATVAYLDSTYETLGYKDVGQLVHIDGGVVTFDSTFMNMGSGTVTLVITTSTGRSAQYVVNVMAVSDDEYSFKATKDGQIVRDNDLLDLTKCLTIKDQYAIAITDYTVVAVDGAEYINEIDDNVLTNKTITFKTVYSTHIIKFAVYININNNIVFVGNYSITLVPNVTVTVNEIVKDNLTAKKEPISYDYSLTLISDNESNFGNLITVTYDDVSININSISCDDPDDRISIDSSTVTFKPVASETTYHLHLYYILNSGEPEEYFVIDVTVTVNPGEYFVSNTDEKYKDIGSECNKDYILDLVLAGDFKSTLKDKNNKLQTDKIQIYDKSGNEISYGYFEKVNKITYIEYTFETSFGARQTFTFVVYPDIGGIEYTKDNKGASQDNAVSATKTTNKSIGSTINLSQYVNIKHKNEDSYVLRDLGLKITTTDIANAGYLMGYDESTYTINFAHSASGKTFCLNIQVPFDETYFADIYKLWVTIPATYGMDAQYLVDDAKCEYVAVETSTKLEDFYSSISTLSGLSALHDTRLVTTNVGDEPSSLTLTEIFGQSGINAIQIETSENILYNTDTKAFTYMAMSDNEYIRFYNDTGLSVKYIIKIKSSVANVLMQNYNNTATGAIAYEKVVYADGKISGTVLSTTDTSAWAMWYTDDDYSSTVKLYWETNGKYISLVGNTTPTDVKFENLDISSDKYGAENFVTYNIHVLTDAGYVGVIHIILVPDTLGYEIGYTSNGKTSEEIYGNIDHLDIYGDDFVNKKPRISINGIDSDGYSTKLSVYTVNNQTMSSYDKYIKIGTPTTGGTNKTIFNLKTVSQDTVIVLNVAISVDDIEVLKFKYNILVKNHLVIDMPYATNKTLDVFLNDFNDVINFAGTDYAQVTLLKYSNDSTSDTGYTSEYISSASLVYTLSNAVASASIENSILTVIEEDWVDAVDAKLSLPLHVATPSGGYYQDYTLIVHPSITIVKNTWSDSGTYNGKEVHSSVNPANGGSEYEIFGFNGNAPLSNTPYKAYTMTTTMEDYTYTNYYLSGGDTVSKLTNTNVSLRYQIIDTDSSISEDGSKWIETTHTFKDGSLSVTLPYVATDRDQIVVYRITIDDITFDHYVMVSNRNIFVINQKEFVINKSHKAFTRVIFANDNMALLQTNETNYIAEICNVYNNGVLVEDFDGLISLGNSGTIIELKKFTNELRFSLKVMAGTTEVGVFGEFRIVPESTEMSLKEYSLVRDFGYSASELGSTDIKIAEVLTTTPYSTYTKEKTITRRNNVTDTLYSYTYSEEFNGLCTLSKTVYALYTTVNAFIVPQQNDINLDTIYINETGGVDLTNYVKVMTWNKDNDNPLSVVDDDATFIIPEVNNFTINKTTLTVPTLSEQVTFQMTVTYTSENITLYKTITVYVNPPESSTGE